MYECIYVMYVCLRTGCNLAFRMKRILIAVQSFCSLWNQKSHGTNDIIVSKLNLSIVVVVFFFLITIIIL